MTDTAPRSHGYQASIEAIADGRDTPRHFLERCLEALERWEPSVHAFATLDIEAARSAADAATTRWKSGQAVSRIDGMPVGIKDIIDTADLPTQMGSPLYEDHQPPFDAASVTGLVQAGAVILGKTVTTEFASTFPGPTANPWDTARTPGGSSSGSAAAVACGMVAGAMGTQVVGSIIRPSSFCGVVGFKPSLGGINRGGSLDLLSQSCSGPIAASLDDAWLMAKEIAVRVGGDPGYPGLMGPEMPPPPKRPKRLGLLHTAGWPLLHEDAAASLDVALRHLRDGGVEILDRASSPALDAVERILADALEVAMRINAYEWRWPLGAFLDRDASLLSQSGRERAALAETITQQDYAGLLQRRAAMRAAWRTLAGSFDGFVSVTAPGAAPLGLEYTGNPVFVVPASVLGVPVVTLPVLQSENLPLGLQILGHEGGDATLFAHAAWIEARLDQ